MKSISQILKHRKFELNKSKRKGNPLYGIASELQQQLDIPLPMYFKLLKKYTIEELRPLITWWSDYPLKRKNNIGLIYWKLKNLYPEKG